MSGNDGHADVQCIVQACEYSSDLLFVWDGQLDARARSLRSHRAASRRRRAHGGERPLAAARSTVSQAAASLPAPVWPSAARPHDSIGAQQRKLLVAQQTPETDVSPLAAAIPSTSGSSSDASTRPPPDGVGMRGRAAGGVSTVGEPDNDNMAVPMCERGSWRATGPGPVQLAMKDNLVVFGAAGCAEVHFLDSNLDWQHLVSLPRTLNVSATLPDGGREWLPLLRSDLFAQQVAVDDSVLAVTAALGAPEVPNVVVMFVRLGGVWEQVDVVQCPECECLGDTRDGCFGGALAVSGPLLVVGNPLNGSALLYSRRFVGPPGRGLEVRWELRQVLTSQWDSGHGGSMFGAALAMSSSFLAVGSPAAVNAGVVIVSLSSNSSARHPFGSVVFDSHEVCCSSGLSCCYASRFGVSVSMMESEKPDFARLATVAIGDPDSVQVHVVTCDADKLGDATAAPCVFTATVLPGYERSSSRWMQRGVFGLAVGVGGNQAVLVADETQGCSSVDNDDDYCGVVCEVPACSPGHCLEYDFSTDTDFCQKCDHPHDCPGGIQSCVREQGNTLWAMTLSLCFFMVLFAALYALSAWARGASVLEIVSDVFCCGLLRYVASIPVVRSTFPDIEQALLSSQAARGGGAEEEDTDDDEEVDGYVPPAVREAFRARREESVVPLTGRGATDFARVAAQRGAEEIAQEDEAGPAGEEEGEETDEEGEESEAEDADGRGEEECADRSGERVGKAGAQRTRAQAQGERGSGYVRVHVFARMYVCMYVHTQTHTSNSSTSSRTHTHTHTPPPRSHSSTSSLSHAHTRRERERERDAHTHAQTSVCSVQAPRVCLCLYMCT